MWLRRLAPLLPICATQVGCVPGFDIAPAEVPHLGANRIVTTSGEWVGVPKRWVATVVPYDGGDAWALMTPHWEGPVQARSIAGPFILRARKDGWSDEPIRFRGQAKVVPPGACLVPSAKVPPPLPPPGTPMVLCVLDDTDRIVEIPLIYIDHVHVDAE